MRFIRVDKNNVYYIAEIDGSAVDYLYTEINKNKNSHMNSYPLFGDYHVVYNDGNAEYDCGDRYIVKAPSAKWDCYDEPNSLDDDDIGIVEEFLSNEKF